jgi:dTDP-4-dehydrorhamnose 3,5-epimerase
VKRIETALPDVILIEPQIFGDARGYFFEVYRQDRYAEHGVTASFVQDNQSCSARGVLRGLHYQLGRPQAKLIRVLSGEIFDVAVDVRRGSPTFGQHVGEVLNAESRRSLFVPVGFAHGFQVLSETAEILYKCSDLYAPLEERGILWNDPDLGIAWPLTGEPTLSPKDRGLPTLKQAPAADLPQYRG